MFFSCVLCRWRPSRRADRSFRGVLLNVFMLIVCNIETSRRGCLGAVVSPKGSTEGLI
jgi:hypothetical protein